MNIKSYTGNYYFKQKIFGGFNLYVEVIATNTDWYDMSESPEFKTFIKANNNIINSNFKLVLK